MNASRHPRAAGAFAFATALILLPGCATKADIRNVTNELQILSARQDSIMVVLQFQSRMTQDSLRGTADQLFEIRGSVNQQLSRIQDELSIVREENVQLHSTLAAIREEITELRRAQVLGPRSGTFPDTGGGDPPVRSDGSAAVELYNVAVRHFNMGNMTAARGAFTDFLQQFPGDELAPEAEYKLADILVEEGRLQEAIQRFERIPQMYPMAAKAPDALYRIGLIHRDEGRLNDARRYLQRVVESYPDTAMAEMAADRLREIGSGR